MVTSSLDQCLTLVELEGVLAHELVHIKRYDTLVAALAVVVIGPVGRRGRSGPGTGAGPFPRRTGPRILGRPAGRRRGALPPGYRCRAGRHEPASRLPGRGPRGGDGWRP